MNTVESTRPQSSVSGFTLIEVLIAMLILALGLLGLGAVFPAVIVQQRNAVTVVEGESVASMAEAIVTSSPEIIDFSDWFDTTLGSPAEHFGKDSTGAITYEWIVGPLEPYNGYQQRPGFVNDNGDPSFNGSQDGYWYPNLDDLDTRPSTSVDLSKALSVADRLIPQPYSGKDPKYVWDLVARRTPGSNRPQLGIFIRLIDQRIRVPINATLSDVLVRTAGTAGDAPALPVALDRLTGKPVVDHEADFGDNIVYAAPQALQVQVVSDHLDWLIFEDANNPMFDTSISFATKPGQKLLDNTGTVRTVLGPATGPDSVIPDTRIVRIDPPFKPSHAANDSVSYNADNNDPENLADEQAKIAARTSWVRQIVFTPRTPLAIRVVTLEENSP
ncbi:MAG: prepilin-type N-terminal cleavage/methylation domain-containing protein [Phycisphaerales bacterium]|nr:prepilin-type N-terminal cleavage/methylation domain-containing protein [Phycisphaerales bacterium]